MLGDGEALTGDHGLIDFAFLVITVLAHFSFETDGRLHSRHVRSRPDELLLHDRRPDPRPHVQFGDSVLQASVPISQTGQHAALDEVSILSAVEGIENALARMQWYSAASVRNRQAIVAMLPRAVTAVRLTPSPSLGAGTDLVESHAYTGPFGPYLPRATKRTLMTYGDGHRVQRPHKDI